MFSSSRDHATPDIVLIMGAPGSGKGTQSPAIAKKYGLRHISTGDIFRKAISDGTEVGKLAESLINDGNLVPDEVTVRVIKESLPSVPVLLDGFPRTVPQAEALDDLVGQLGRTISAVLWIDVPDDVLTDRIVNRCICKQCSTQQRVGEFEACPSCGGQFFSRDDDTKESLVRRLEVFNRDTLPILTSHYNNVIRVNGNCSPEEVAEQFMRAL